MVDLFILEHAPEAFHRGVVVAISFLAHRRRHLWLIDVVIPKRSSSKTYSWAQYWLPACFGFLLFNSEKVWDTDAYQRNKENYPKNESQCPEVLTADISASVVDGTWTGGVGRDHTHESQ